MQPRISLITLGVASIARSRQFYEKLGFVASSASNENVVFFQAGSMALALYGREALAEDATISSVGTGFSGITLAHNVHQEQDVDALLAEAVSVGATLVKPGQRVFWGGYSGYFADLDGYLWEVAHNPFFAIGADGALQLP